MAGPTPAQLEALSSLASVLPPDAYLGGGVAVALRLGHRTSHDLDIFVRETDPLLLEARLLEIEGITIESRAEGTLYSTVLGVPTSILAYRSEHLEPPSLVSAVCVPVASLADLACMKLSAISQRGAARDFWDLHVILKETAGGLPELLEHFARKYPRVDIGHVVRSLVYFGDAVAEPPPRGMTATLWAEVRADMEERVRQL